MVDLGFLFQTSTHDGDRLASLAPHAAVQRRALRRALGRVSQTSPARCAARLAAQFKRKVCVALGFGDGEYDQCALENVPSALTTDIGECQLSRQANSAA